MSPKPALPADRSTRSARSPVQAAPPATSRRVIVWNVQRVFHPRGSALSRALDATEAQGWTRAAYNEKIARIAAVLRTLCDESPPALLALIEVENAAVVSDILRAAGWTSLVDTEVEREDIAGYDIALAYDRKLLSPAGPARSFNIHNRYSTRDVLEVPLATSSGSRLTVVHNHWPSRILSEAEALRIGAADYVSRMLERRLKVGKEDLMTERGAPRLPARAVLEERWDESLLVLGDFNDNPFDTSLRLLLSSTRERTEVLKRPRLPLTRGASAVAAYLALRPRLYNPSWAMLGGSAADPHAALGTHRYGRDWFLPDQVLCSRGLLVGRGGPTFAEGSLRVVAPDHVMVGGRRVQMRTKGGEPIPYDAKLRTGVSDHFPVVADLTWPT